MLSVSAGISEVSSDSVVSVTSALLSVPASSVSAFSPAPVFSVVSESFIASADSGTSVSSVSSVTSVSFCPPAAYTTCSAGTAVMQRLNAISHAAILFPA